MLTQLPAAIGIHVIGMLILLSWAVSNIIIGGIGWNMKTGVKMYFHQMNLFWNIVNLTIAVIAVITVFNTHYDHMPVEELIEETANTEWLFLLNGFLDMVYIAVGLLLIFFSKKTIKRSNLLKGYGRSVILQGAFLLVFDFVMYDILHSLRT